MNTLLHTDRAWRSHKQRQRQQQHLLHALFNTSDTMAPTRQKKPTKIVPPPPSDDDEEEEEEAEEPSPSPHNTSQSQSQSQSQEVPIDIEKANKFLDEIKQQVRREPKYQFAQSNIQYLPSFLPSFRQLTFPFLQNAKRIQIRSLEIEKSHHHRLQKIQKNMQISRKAYEKKVRLFLILEYSRHLRHPHLLRLRELLQEKKNVERELEGCYGRIEQGYSVTAQQFQVAVTTDKMEEDGWMWLMMDENMFLLSRRIADTTTRKNACSFDLMCCELPWRCRCNGGCIEDTVRTRYTSCRLIVRTLVGSAVQILILMNGVVKIESLVTLWIGI
ncbi:uncharacterized protein MYCFIDRAFT_176947 [Pseudocercospora fijiensis CIRAD86]|uniref:Uncharacterized protein n=1 Tax=Pseudocercospora fijiensis (strain CIRAD86) TaxID=383855 RepID=M3AR83_PSEFD|nr:uncharacterized protein MYCFIDRAFT_176947 [Pseudocercospora fijiensis CIRAD86]EME79947.1 hypothetical protein MYCFIDRAFT_176947 [Pseudocercospora fijiensis CIRAD86]